MPDNLGARLRQRREEQGIALVTIAEQTKIKLALLDGLERGDVSHWPSGIFRRAYIRAYAQAIGLNPDVIVHQFVQAHPEPSEHFETALSQALAASPRANTAPPTRLRNIVGSALDSLTRFRRVSMPGGAETAGAEANVLGGQEPRVQASPGKDIGLPAHVLEEFAALDRSLEMANDTEREVFAPVIEVASDDPPQPAAPEVAAPSPVAERMLMELPEPGPDLTAIAQLCTDFGRLETTDAVAPLLEQAAGLLDAVGLIVWIWDAADGLRPALAHGYSDRVLAQLPTVRGDADNATAAAFRTVRTCAISGNGRDNGALVVPLLMPDGCAGVLALELPDGAEQKEPVRAVATIFAAQLAQLIARSYAAEVRLQTEIALEETQLQLQAGVGR